MREAEGEALARVFAIKSDGGLDYDPANPAAPAETTGPPVTPDRILSSVARTDVKKEIQRALSEIDGARKKANAENVNWEAVFAGYLAGKSFEQLAEAFDLRVEDIVTQAARRNWDSLKAAMTALLPVAETKSDPTNEALLELRRELVRREQQERARLSAELNYRIANNLRVDVARLSWLVAQDKLRKQVIVRSKTSPQGYEVVELALTPQDRKALAEYTAQVVALTRECGVLPEEPAPSSSAAPIQAQQSNVYVVLPNIVAKPREERTGETVVADSHNSPPKSANLIDAIKEGRDSEITGG